MKKALLLSAALVAATPHMARAENESLQSMNREVKIKTVEKMERLLRLNCEVASRATCDFNVPAQKLSEEQVDTKRKEIAGLRNLLGQLGITVITTSMVEDLKKDLGLAHPEKKEEDDLSIQIRQVKKEGLKIERADDAAVQKVLGAPQSTLQPQAKSHQPPSSVSSTPVATPPTPPKPTAATPSPAKQEIQSGDDLLELLK